MPFLKEFIINNNTKIKLWEVNLGELDPHGLDEYDNDDLSYLRTKLRQLNLLQRTGVIDKMMMKKRQEELLRRHNF